MNHPIRMTAALLALLGAVGLAQAEGGPGDSGAGGSGPNGSARAVNGNGTGPTSTAGARSKSSKPSHMKRAHGSSNAASGAKSDGAMSNPSAGKGG